MKGLEKLNYPRLAKVLTQEGKVSAEALTEALRENAEAGTPLPDILIRDGLASEWDLARAISQEFSLPILMPSSYQIDKEVLGLVPVELIRKTRVLPIDRFGGILTVAMPLMATHQDLQSIAVATHLEVFPYVSPLSEVQRLIEEKLPKPAAPEKSEDEQDWQKLFDEADQKVKKSPD